MTSQSHKPLRIVQVVRSAVYGGVENHVYELCRHLKEAGVEVLLVSLVDCEVRSDFKDLNIEIIRLHDSVQWSPRALKTIFEFRNLIKKLNPHIVHLHGIRPTLVGSLATVLGRVGKRPAVVSTLHGAYSLMAVGESGDPQSLLLLLAKLFHWTGFILSDRVIVDCQTLTDEVKKVYQGMTFNIDRVLQRKVRVAYNGVDLRPFTALHRQPDTLRRDIGLPDHTVVVGAIARLDEPKKGIAVLLRAARIVLEQQPDVHFVISGEGYSRTPLELLAQQLGITDRVHFLGYWENIVEVYRALDIFVLPSFSEGFPTVNLEAMAASLPVVTTDVGGAAEAVRHGECGFVVPPRNETLLAEAILRLCQDRSTRLAMGAKAKLIVNEMFGSDATAARILTVYKEVTEIDN